MQSRPAPVTISHEEPIDNGLAAPAEPADLIATMQKLRSAGAGTLVVSRAADPTPAPTDDDVVAVRIPPLQAAEPKGADDSMTAGMVAGAACRALNVVRRRLGTGPADTVATLADPIEILGCDNNGTERP